MKQEQTVKVAAVAVSVAEKKKIVLMNIGGHHDLVEGGETEIRSCRTTS